MSYPYISTILNGYDAMDMEDYVGQPALAGTDEESAEYLTLDDLYVEVDFARKQASRRRPRRLAERPLPGEAKTLRMEDMVIAHADGEVPMAEEDFLAFCAGLAAEPF